jgi:hypothetical protein
MTIAIDLDTHLASNLTALAQQGVANTNNFAHYANLAFTKDLDGAIQQIVFEIGPSGCTTTASRNDEQVHKYPSYNERRALDTLPVVRRLLAQSKPAAMRQNIKALQLRKG